MKLKNFLEVPTRSSTIIIIQIRKLGYTISIKEIMKNLLTLTLLSLALTVTCMSCAKESTRPQVADDVTAITSPTPDTPATEASIVYGRTVDLGTGSGVLNISGKTLALKCNDLLKIKSGTYTGINITDILSADGCPITIKNDGLVEVVGDFNQMTLKNISNVIISGDGTSTIAKGFVFRDNKYRAIQMEGTINKLTIQNMSFKNVADYVISFQSKILYTGAASSYSKGLKFLNISCNNTGQFLNTYGLISNGIISGLIRDIEIAYLDFRNSANVGSVVLMGLAEDYNFHNNRIDNVNTTNNNHNGIFSVSGNGSFHDNYISNHQGNAIRAWGASVGTTPKNILIYNNIVVNSRKYSGFEVQGFDAFISAGKSTYTNAIVFNNTCGNLNTSNDWQGNVVDVYSLKGGKCDVYNNLAFNLPAGSTIAGQESDLAPNVHNNLYYTTSSNAGIVDQKEFRLASSSPAKSAGSVTPFTIKDYYGAMRSAKPSAGAVE